MNSELMPEYSNAEDDQLIWQEPASSSLIDFNEKEDFGRFLVEILLYVSIAGRAFGFQLGILRIPKLSGAIILVCGIVCLAVMLIKRQKIPVSFYFALGVNILANFSQVFAVGQLPIFGDYLRDLLFWMCLLLMTCYVVRNDNASRRTAVVLAVIAIMAVWLGGFAKEAGTVGTKIARLKLEGVGTMFANANDLGYLVAIAAITLLFFSLTSRKKIKPLYWLLVLLLIVILLRTISRGALLFFGIGVIFFLLAVLFGKGGKIGLVVLILLGMFASGRFAYQFAETKEAYRYRLYAHSRRLEVWRSMPGDMKDTIIFGKGPAEAYTFHRAVQPHNTFFWLHLAYGGPCAWMYLAWIALLCVRGIRMLCSPLVPLQQKITVLGIFSVAMGCQIMSNFGPENYGAILGMAITDRYTSMFSKRQMILRRWELQDNFDEVYNYPDQEVEIKTS